MKIFRCVKTNWISQGFGAEKTLPRLRDTYKSLGLLGHTGLDFVSACGTKLYWDGDIKGKVIQLYSDAKFGLGVIIITENEDGIFKHRFWHLQSFKIASLQLSQYMEGFLPPVLNDNLQR